VRAPTPHRRRPRIRLPASTLAAINNVVALKLEARITMTVVGAILAPLLPDAETPPQRRRKKPGPKRRYKRRRNSPNGSPPPEGADDGPRERARAALAANPGKSLTAIAKLVKCSRSTVVNARDDMAADGRKQVRKEARKSAPKPETTERRQRAQRFLKDALAHGPKRVTGIEEAAEKAHIDIQTLEQARGDLSVVTSRGNTGGVRAVEWSLPG